MEKLELFYLYRISGALTLHNPVSGQTEGRRELAKAELTKDGFMIKNPKQSSALWTDSGFGNGIKNDSENYFSPNGTGNVRFTLWSV
jgi:hypothetical protein